jgi:phenylalanyl-tRNA synthetase beta chain
MPTHAYDKNKIGKIISVAKQSAIIKVLGNKEIKIIDGLLVSDEEKPISVAGIIGIEETKVTNSTSVAIMEMARFNVKDIRKTAKQVKIDTSAFKQSSKNSNAGQMELGFSFLTSKLKDFSNIINLELPKKNFIIFDENYINKIAGFELTKESKYKESLKSLIILGFEFKENKVYFPTTRHDLESMQDICEEIFRFYGYANFKAAPFKSSPTKTLDSINKASIISSLGYKQVATYTLTSNEKNKINIFNNKTTKLKTFVSNERTEIRNSIIISLIETANYNKKRMMPTFSLFDIGQIGNKSQVLGLLSNSKDFYKIKSDIYNIFSSKLIFKRADNPVLHNNVSAYIYQGSQMIG